MNNHLQIEQYKELSANLHNIKNYEHPNPKILFKVIKEKKQANKLEKEFLEPLQIKYCFFCPEIVKLISNPSFNVVKMALSKNISLSQDIDHLCVEMQEILLNKGFIHGLLIKHMDESLQYKLIDESLSNIDLILNPTETIQELVLNEDMGLFPYINNLSVRLLTDIISKKDINDYNHYIFGRLSSGQWVLSSEVINLIYSSTNSTNVKKALKSLPNYKTTAQIILERVKANQ